MVKSNNWEIYLLSLTSHLKPSKTPKAQGISAQLSFAIMKTESEQ